MSATEASRQRGRDDEHAAAQLEVARGAALCCPVLPLVNPPECRMSKLPDRFKPLHAEASTHRLEPSQAGLGGRDVPRQSAR